jgi:glycosyltransferase involved in cell wall biosynthesis
MMQEMPIIETDVSTGQADQVRVLLVITRLTIGGDTNVVLDIASYLNSHPNYKVDLAAGPVPDTEIDLTHLAHERGIPTILIPSLVNHINPAVNLKAVRELWKVITTGQYAIVHTHSSVAGIVGRIAAFTARTPIIVHHIHGWGLQPDMSSFMRMLYLTLERMCALFSDCLIGVSKATIQKGFLYRVGSQNKFVLIYNGINLEKFRQDVDRTEVLTELGLIRNARLWDDWSPG